MKFKPWKYVLRFNHQGGPDYYGHEKGRYEDTTFEIPVGATYLSCVTQIDTIRYGYDPQITIYFDVPVDFAKTEKHSFRVVGTNEEHELALNERHLKTISINKGERVWHVYHVFPSEQHVV
jgi:hypothetical protein